MLNPKGKAEAKQILIIKKILTIQWAGPIKAIDSGPGICASSERHERHTDQKMIMKYVLMDLPIPDLNMQHTRHKSNALSTEVLEKQLTRDSEKMGR